MKNNNNNLIFAEINKNDEFNNCDIDHKNESFKKIINDMFSSFKNDHMIVIYSKQKNNTTQQEQEQDEIQKKIKYDREKKRQYYLKNKDKIIEYSKQQYKKIKDVYHPNKIGRPVLLDEIKINNRKIYYEKNKDIIMKKYLDRKNKIKEDKLKNGIVINGRGRPKKILPDNYIKPEPKKRGRKPIEKPKKEPKIREIKKVEKEIKVPQKRGPKPKLKIIEIKKTNRGRPKKIKQQETNESEIIQNVDKIINS